MSEKMSIAELDVYLTDVARRVSTLNIVTEPGDLNTSWVMEGDVVMHTDGIFYTNIQCNRQIVHISNATYLLITRVGKDVGYMSKISMHVLYGEFTKESADLVNKHVAKIHENYDKKEKQS